MATYRQSEDLPVWQKAMDLACEVYDVTEGEVFRHRFSLRDQMERSSLACAPSGTRAPGAGGHAPSRKAVFPLDRQREACYIRD